MPKQLAVFTTDLGLSFVNKHVLNLHPNRTVVVSRFSHIRAGSGWESNGVPVTYLDRWRNKLSVRLKIRCGASESAVKDAAIRRFLESNNVSVVLGEFIDYFVDFVPLLNQLQIPYVAQSHGMDASASMKQPGMAERYLAYTSAKAVLTRCELHRQRLIKTGLPSEKVFVNRGGVDVPASIPQRSKEAANRMLAVGYMTAKKSPVYILEAFRRAAKQDPQVTLDYVGAGPLFPAAVQLVDAFGLEGRVRLHGSVSEEVKLKLLSECGVFLQHSVTDKITGDEEGVPASIQEAMAHGMAVVSTRHSGIPDAVLEGQNGLLTDEGDVEGMSNAILAIRERVEEFGKRSHELALAENSWDCEKARLRRFLGLDEE